jgi:hypothetical protein
MWESGGKAPSFLTLALDQMMDKSKNPVIRTNIDLPKYF